MAAAQKWIPVEGTHAEFSHRCVQRDGVEVLVVTLRGSVSRRGDEVSRLTDALNRLGTTVDGDPSVSVLDVLGFSNAGGDEAGTLTTVFAGLPCCWASKEWDAQNEDRGRWDLPTRNCLAATVPKAITRMVKARKKGHFLLKPGSATRAREEVRWTDRGALVREDGRRGAMTSLYHRNRLVERVLHDPGQTRTRVLWPFTDRTGEHLTLRDTAVSEADRQRLRGQRDGLRVG